MGGGHASTTVLPRLSGVDERLVGSLDQRSVRRAELVGPVVVQKPVALTLKVGGLRVDGSRNVVLYFSYV